MADEETKPKRLIFSGAVSVGNILNAAVIVVGVIVFIVQGRAAVDVIERGLTDLKYEFREYKREVRDDIKELSRRIDTKVDR